MPTGAAAAVGLSSAEVRRRLVNIPAFAIRGILMTPLPASIVGGVFATAVVRALVLGLVKIAIFSRLEMV